MYSLSKQLNSLNSESSLAPRFLENVMWTHIIMNLFYRQAVVRGNTTQTRYTQSKKRAERREQRVWNQR